MIVETIRMAFHSLSVNRLRTFLSMLGIVIGVAAVVSIVSVGRSAQEEVAGQIGTLGSDLIWVAPGAAGVTGDPRQGFTLDIVEHIDAFSPDVVSVVPEISTGVRLAHDGSGVRATVVGTSSGFAQANFYFPVHGRFLDDSDQARVRNSLVLGSRIANDLFEAGNPLGRRVRVHLDDRRVNFTVIGVMEEKGQGITGNLDTRVYIPITTYLQRLRRSAYVDRYYAQAAEGAAREARRQVEFFFYRYLGDADRFTIFSQDQILDVLDQVTGTLGLMLGGIAAISLVVGGIGIMNIMLVSVTERTREIGIRKALGARRRDILRQFLFEALTLSGLGGVIGLGLGWLGTYIVTRIGGWALVVSALSVALAFGFALAIGLFFGIYPAVKAARLDPVVALSYE